jgi:hypothetical protein
MEIQRMRDVTSQKLILPVACCLLLLLALPARSDETVQGSKATAAPSEAVATTGAAQPAAAPAPSAESERDELSRRATDPTASPLTFGVINDVMTSYRDLEGGTPIDENGYTLKFQPVIPFKAWRIAHILRMTVPYQVSGPGPEGLEDLTVFDMVILPQSWGRLGVGVVGSFAAATSDVSAHASAGPAIGFVAGVSKKLNLGLFNQNVFGNDVALSQIQPIAAYQLGSGWSLSLGDLQWVYDWDRDEFVSMPVGVQLGKVLPVAKQPMRFAVNPQYDLKDLPGSSRFKVLFTVTLLLPEKRAK